MLLLVGWAVLISLIPPPAFRWRDEAAARREIAAFLQNEAAIATAWQEIVAASRRGDATFEQLAGRIETDITDSYERSFEHLSHMPVSPALPSGAQLDQLRDYAARRRDASRLLAEGLRDGDAKKVQAAMALERKSRLPRAEDKTP